MTMRILETNVGGLDSHAGSDAARVSVAMQTATANHAYVEPEVDRLTMGLQVYRATIAARALEVIS